MEKAPLQKPIPLIQELGATAARAERAALAQLLQAVVQDGASVNFMLPFELAEAAAFWDGIFADVESGGRRLLVARTAPGGPVQGTVHLGFPWAPNQRHRVDVNKLLVHPRARRQGLARALMLAAEALAREQGRSLLTLDTRHGDSAEPLYHALGYVLAGIIPGYAAPPEGGAPQAASFFYKQL
jgi:ribosomal protein S18 acetylase RimI-like enzyme